MDLNARRVNRSRRGRMELPTRIRSNTDGFGNRLQVTLGELVLLRAGSREMPWLVAPASAGSSHPQCGLISGNGCRTDGRALATPTA